MIQNLKGVGFTRKAERSADALWWRRSGYAASDAPNL
jgi:hypothetical protein